MATLGEQLAAHRAFKSAEKDAVNPPISEAVAQAKSDGMPNKAAILGQLQALRRALQHCHSLMPGNSGEVSKDIPIYDHPSYETWLHELTWKVSATLDRTAEPKVVELNADLPEFYHLNQYNRPIRYCRKISVFRNGFECEDKAFEPFIPLIDISSTWSQLKKKNYATLADVELEIKKTDFRNNIISKYNEVFHALKLRENKESDNSNRLANNLSIVAQNNDSIKTLSYVQVSVALRECTPTYKDVLRYLIKHDLSDKLKQHLYLEEDIYINDFFSPEAEAQLPLKELWSHLATVLSQKQ